MKKDHIDKSLYDIMVSTYKPFQMLVLCLSLYLLIAPYLASTLLGSAHHASLFQIVRYSASPLFIPPLVSFSLGALSSPPLFFFFSLSLSLPLFLSLPLSPSLSLSLSLSLSISLSYHSLSCSPQRSLYPTLFLLRSFSLTSDACNIVFIAYVHVCNNNINTMPH